MSADRFEPDAAVVALLPPEDAAKFERWEPINDPRPRPHHAGPRRKPYRSECMCPCHTRRGMLHMQACCEPDPDRDAESIARVAARRGFDEDHSVERGPARRGSIKRSHRAEGRNFID